MVELGADKLKIRFQTGFQSRNELIGLKAMCVLRGNSKRISVDRAIFFPRQMLCCVRRQSIERRNKTIRLC